MRHPNRQGLHARKQRHQGHEFKAARRELALSVPDTAKLLRVSVRTIRNWETGVARVPYTAFKLMRLLRGGKVLGPTWRDFFIRGDRLITPEGHEFNRADLAWWSLLIRQAIAFRALAARSGWGPEPTLPLVPRTPRPSTERPARSGGAHLSPTATCAPAAGASASMLASTSTGAVESGLSMPRALGRAAGKDPKCSPKKGQALPKDVVAERKGAGTTTNTACRMERAKSLISKGKSSDFLRRSVPLSLTPELRPENTAPSKPRNRRKGGAQ